ncbi:MAG: DUF6249 domain-containing protein [Cyclobacteriaceae bacterium]
MHPEILGIMLPIIITLAAFVMVVYLRKYTNMERMSMIEKGVSPEFFKVQQPGTGPLRWASLLIGCGIGLLMGYFLDKAFDMDEVGYFSMLLAFGGLGLAFAYVIEEKKNQKNQK